MPKKTVKGKRPFIYVLSVVTGNINVANQINVMNVAGRRKRRHLGPIGDQLPDADGPMSNSIPGEPIKDAEECWKKMRRKAAQVIGILSTFSRDHDEY